MFVSAALEDKNHVFAVLLSIPSTSNDRFPATDSGLQSQMFEKKETFTEDVPLQELDPYCMPLHNTALIKLMSESPVAAVQFYKTLFEVRFQIYIDLKISLSYIFLYFQAFLYILVGIPPPEQVNEVPLNHHSRKGMYGIVTDISLVHETNGRYRHCDFRIIFYMIVHSDNCFIYAEVPFIFTHH